MLEENNLRKVSVVKFFNNRRGFGFLEPVDGSKGSDVFLHHKQCRNAFGEFIAFNEGDEVDFQLGDLGRGPIALDAFKVP